MEHQFTNTIKEILYQNFGEHADKIFDNSLLIQYVNEKTRSANRGSKSRGSFANLYAIYVIIEDYLNHGFDKNEGYKSYEGAAFSPLFTRQRELPFGEKLQNHALNNRMNAEFQKYFPFSELTPIIRNLETNRYWINENLIKVNVENQTFNIAQSIIQIINEYVKAKQDAFLQFVKTCKEIQRLGKHKKDEVEAFIIGLLAPNVDARLFEIVSYSILKYYYHDQQIYWGYDLKHLNKENLQLFKTGRTNANDGEIDFVMRPLGRFFQVTETLDFKKYFLDIDKIQRYPITFVIKSNESKDEIISKIRENAIKSYTIDAIVNNYMNCIEEIINIPILTERFNEATKQGYLNDIMDEIITQSKAEYNFEDENE